MNLQEFEKLPIEEKECFFADLEKKSAALLAEKAELLKHVQLQRAQLKSMQVDMSNSARKHCKAQGLSADKTDELLTIIRKAPGGLRELRNIFESAIPCSGNSELRECFAAILVAVGRSDAWAELMGHE